jgi:hypothetical protein
MAPRKVSNVKGLLRMVSTVFLGSPSFFSYAVNHEDRLFWCQLLDPDSQFIALHDRHLKIRRHQIKLALSEYIQRLHTIVRFRDRMIVDFEDHAKGSTDAWLVVHQEYAFPAKDLLFHCQFTPQSQRATPRQSQTTAITSSAVAFISCGVRGAPIP